MSEDVRVGVVGATGALGGEIVRVLDRAPWRPAHLVAMAGPATRTPFVDYGDGQVPVDDVTEGAIADLDVVFLAVPPDVARSVGDIALAEGVPIVDASGVFAEDDDVPLVVPWVNPGALAEVPLRGVVGVPHGPALLLASVVAPLVRAGAIGGIDATVFLPASAWGRAGIEELSGQVVALFNSSAPPRRVFETGLAFDLLPIVGGVGATGRTEAEDRVAIELAELLGLSRAPRIEVVGVPVFSGVSASLRLALGRSLDLALVRRILSDGGVGVADEPRAVPRPRRVEGRPFAEVGRIRLEEDRLALWAGVDNLRGVASAAVSAAAILLRNAGHEIAAGGRGD